LIWIMMGKQRWQIDLQHLKMQMRQKSNKLLFKRNPKHKQRPKYKLNHKQLVRLPRVKKHSLKVEISKLPLLVLGLQFQEVVEVAEVEEKAEERVAEKAVVKAVVNTEAEAKDKKVAIEAEEKAEVKAEAEEKEEVMLKVKPKELIQGIEQR